MLGGSVTLDVSVDNILVIQITDIPNNWGLQSSQDDNGILVRNDPDNDGHNESVSGESLDDIDLDTLLPQLSIGDGSLSDWIRMTDDIDEACKRQINFLQDYPLIPDGVDIHGYICEVESNALRRPHERISEKINTRV